MAVWGSGNWEHDKYYYDMWPYDKDYNGMWPYDSGYPSSIFPKPNMSSAEFERRGNAAVAEEVNKRLERANQIMVLKNFKTSVCETQQSNKLDDSIADNIFNPIAEDIKLLSKMVDVVIGNLCDRFDRAQEKRKLMRMPMPKKISFVSTTRTKC